MGAQATSFYADIVKTYTDDQLRAAATSNAPLTAKEGDGTSVKNAAAPITYARAMHLGYQDPIARTKVEAAFKAFVAQKLGTTDIGPMLVDTIAPRFAFVRRQRTTLLNLIEMLSAGRQLVVKDWLYRIREAQIGNLRASRMNPEATISTTYQNMVYGAKENVLAFWGDPVSVSWVASEQASQQEAIQLLNQQVDAQMERMRNAKNYDYHNGIMQSNFSGNNVTQVGGLLQRIVSNVKGCGGVDITTTILETETEKLSLYTSPADQRYLIAGSTRTLDAIRSIEVNRYDGNNPTAFAQWEADQAAKFRAYKVPYTRIYEPTDGMPIPCVTDPDLDGTKAILLNIEPGYAPMEANFLIGGTKGPHMFTLPTGDMRDVKLIVEGATLDDPAEQLRALFTNLPVFS